MSCASPDPPAKASRSGSASSSRVGAVTEYPAASAPVGDASPARSGIAASTGAGLSHGRIPLWRKTGLIVEIPGAERRPADSLRKRSRPKGATEGRALDETVRGGANRIGVRPESAREMKNAGRGRKRTASRRPASRPNSRQIALRNGLSRDSVNKTALPEAKRPRNPNGRCRRNGAMTEDREVPPALSAMQARALSNRARNRRSRSRRKACRSATGRSEIRNQRREKGARQCA